MKRLKAQEQTLKKQLDVAQEKLSRLSRQQVLKREGNMRQIAELETELTSVRKEKEGHKALVSLPVVLYGVSVWAVRLSPNSFLISSGCAQRHGMRRNWKRNGAHAKRAQPTSTGPPG